ncbi:hypothetical protein C0674_09715 [Sporolactobacillus terrae]|uniref:Uncharacterized protein n=1 Tax=Sporolactobacillus terrae TaxID=269673 RepID=A0ABX5Q8A9_9BACL|nr:hypothetical protein C0674_09715 [Sporolactobacillus terrae]QAA25851.1 hypothetical protein C0679_09695 [Sporolactobacillus terrae]
MYHSAQENSSRQTAAAAPMNGGKAVPAHCIRLMSSLPARFTLFFSSRFHYSAVIIDEIPLICQ